MQDARVTIWKLKTAERLATALTLVDDPETMRQFLRDVMTEKEIIEVSSRLEAACMLRGGAKYMDIVEKTKLSSRTIARISDWLQGGCGGYVKVLDLIESHTGHMPPVRVE